MSQYRRSGIGLVFFYTVVTERRRRILTTDLGRLLLREAVESVREGLRFRTIACVLLPDHIHTIWELPLGDVDYSTRWKKIKTTFTKNWKRNGGRISSTSASRRRKGELGVWQRRFFEHTCRDEHDLKRCVDYIHVNPLKHGLVERVRDWPWSTFHRFVEAGEYSIDWGSADIWYGDEFRYFE